MELMSLNNRNMCNRRTLAAFLQNELEENDRLDFLFHLDNCSNCWDRVYNATKASHPHYYKRSNYRNKALEEELKRLEGPAPDSREVFEVA
jgi:hypothetical protein